MQRVSRDCVKCGRGLPIRSRFIRCYECRNIPFPGERTEADDIADEIWATQHTFHDRFTAADKQREKM